MAKLNPLGLLILTAASSALADEPRSHTASDLYRSAYFLGRGDTGIATADEEDAIFYNPAGIAYGKGIYKKTVLAAPTVEISQSTRDLIREISAQDADMIDTVVEQKGKPNHLGAGTFTGLILRRAALGVFARTNVDLLAYNDPEGGGLESVKASANETAGLAFTLADGFFGNRLLFGVTAKFLQRGRGELAASTADIETAKEQFSDTSNFLATGTGGGADIGLMYRSEGRISPAFGITVNDVGNSAITPEEDTQLDLDVKQTVNLGTSIETGTKFSRLKLLFDYRDALGSVEKNTRKKIHLGSELSVLDAVGVTGGLNQGYPSFGMYTDLYLVRLDLGMYTEEVGSRVGTRPDSRYFFKLFIGF